MNAPELAASTQAASEASDVLTPLLRSPRHGLLVDPVAPAQAAAMAAAPPLAQVGQLLALVDGGTVALVRTAQSERVAPALRARSTVNLQARHIGAEVVLVYESGQPDRPIIVGVMGQDHAWPLGEPPGQVEVQADGQRMLITAREQLVLRCGQASITLSSDGKVEVHGQTIVTQAVAANRIRGGSVELN